MLFDTNIVGDQAWPAFFDLATAGLAITERWERDHAEVILDTGPITGEGEVGGTSTSWKAQQFDLDQRVVVNSLEGYMYRSVNGLESPVEAAIYAHGEDGFPSERLFGSNFSVLNTGEDGADWFGVSDVSWTLDEGTYWAVFGVQLDNAAVLMPFDTGSDAVTAMYNDPSDPEDPPSWRWLPGIEGRKLGVRISGTIVPEPSHSMLPALLFASYAFRRSHRRVSSTVV